MNGRGQRPRRCLTRVQQNKQSFVHLYSAREHQWKLAEPRESVTGTSVGFRGAAPAGSGAENTEPQQIQDKFTENVEEVAQRNTVTFNTRKGGAVPQALAAQLKTPVAKK